MKKFPKPWYRASRGVWYVTLKGTQHNLGPDRQAAFDRYKALLNAPEPQPERENVAPSTSVVGIIQQFMADVRANAAAGTVEWYRQRLQLFTDYLSEKDLQEMQVRELKRGIVKKWMNAYPHLSQGSRRNLGRASKIYEQGMALPLRNQTIKAGAAKLKERGYVQLDEVAGSGRVTFEKIETVGGVRRKYEIYFDPNDAGGPNWHKVVTDSHGQSYQLNDGGYVEAFGKNNKIPKVHIPGRKS